MACVSQTILSSDVKAKAIATLISELKMVHSAPLLIMRHIWKESSSVNTARTIPKFTSYHNGILSISSHSIEILQDLWTPCPLIGLVLTEVCYALRAERLTLTSTNATTHSVSLSLLRA
jgi:hypothetical protein